MANHTKIPKTEEIQKVSLPVIEDAEQVLDLIEQTYVSSNETLESAVYWIAEIKNKHSEVDEKRKTFTEPLRDVVDRINAEFKPALETLKLAESRMKAKVSDFVSLRKAHRDGLLAKVGNMELTTTEQGALLKEADSLELPKVSGLSIRESWTGEVIDAEAILRWAIENGRLDVLSVNEKALSALSKALNTDPKIPGWRAFKSSVVAITTNRVKKPAA